MIDCSSIPVLPSCYDLFLYASVCNQRNGTQLSVISIFARMNIDSWEEAARLAAMPRVTAEKTLSSVLGQTADTSCDRLEAEVTAARLIQLLPSNDGNGLATSTDTARGDVDRSTM
jgi:hypothetical protein